MKKYIVQNANGERDEVEESNIHLAEKDGYFPVVFNDDKETDTVPYAKIKLAEKDGYRPMLGGEFSYVDSVKDAAGEYADNIKDMVNRPGKFLDTLNENASDFVLPLKNLVTRGAAAVPATAEYVSDRVTKDGKPRSFSDTYDENLDESLKFQDERRNGNKLAQTLGNDVGIVTSGGVGAGNVAKQGAGAAAKRLAANTALGAVEGATSGKEIASGKDAVTGGIVGGAITSAIEALPYAGKAFGYVGKKGIRAIFGVGEESTQELWDNPEVMNELIAKGDEGIREITEKVDKAYKKAVTDVITEAEERVKEAEIGIGIGKYERSHLETLREDAKAKVAQLEKEKAQEIAKIKEAGKRAEQDKIASLKNVRPDDSVSDEVVEGVKKQKSVMKDEVNKAYDTLDGTDFDKDEILSITGAKKQSGLINGLQPKEGDNVGMFKTIDEAERLIKNNPDGERNVFEALNKVPNLKKGESRALLEKMEPDEVQEALDMVPGLTPKDKELIMSALDGDGSIEEASRLKGVDFKKIMKIFDNASESAYTTYGTHGAAERIKEVRRSLDEVLKGHAPYQKQMEIVAPQTKLVVALEEMFGDATQARRALLDAADPEQNKKIMTLVRALDDKNKTDIAGKLKDYIEAQGTLRNPEKLLELRRTMRAETDGKVASALDDEFVKSAKSDLASKAGKVESVKKRIENLNREKVSAKDLEKVAKNNADRFDRLTPKSSQNTIDRISNPKNFKDRDQVKDLLGEEGLKDAKRYSYAKDFNGGKTEGGRRTVPGVIIGGAIGTLLAGPLGTGFGLAIGGGTGALIDKNGGKFAQALINGAIKTGPFIKQIEKAAEKGRGSVLMTHISLMKTNAEYRKIIEDQAKESETSE